MESLGFSIYIIISSADGDTFVSSFCIWMLSVYFSCLIVIARIAETMLNRSGESEHSCLVLDPGGNTKLFPLTMTCSVCFFVYNLYYVEVCSVYSYFFGNFKNHKWKLNFLSNAFSASVKMIIRFLSFILLIQYITSIYRC